MKLKVLKSKRDYEAALKEVDALLGAKPGTAAADRLEVLGILVEDYEERHFPFEAPDPIEAIKFRMEQQGLKNSDLAKLLGGRNRVSEVLSRKRRLSLAMMKKLHQKWGISAESLLAG